MSLVWKNDFSENKTLIVIACDTLFSQRDFTVITWAQIALLESYYMNNEVVHLKIFILF